MIRIVRVSGLSMSPGMMPGDFAAALNWPASLYRPGQRVLVQHPAFGLIIKRLDAVEEGVVWLSGDSPLSSTREAMGCQPLSALRGRVIAVVRRRRPG
ncbi:S24/S26 family peptidase [Marinobacterium lutimaris]|uniref:Peptidase S24-like n=1 Tax=Marinobacterium lutimaris TaxID=568106 RepID=A0A1H5VH97_9GAMM|nr:S24/S26 family peptidase [Marinobacterium lutimaris]SEF86181.1 Peptidase S24-like [Marinobacterium lutimaris]